MHTLKIEYDDEEFVIYIRKDSSNKNIGVSCNTGHSFTLPDCISEQDLSGHLRTIYKSRLRAVKLNTDQHVNLLTSLYISENITPILQQCKYTFALLIALKYVISKIIAKYTLVKYTDNDGKVNSIRSDIEYEISDMIRLYFTKKELFIMGETAEDIVVYDIPKGVKLHQWELSVLNKHIYKKLEEVTPGDAEPATLGETRPLNQQNPSN